MGNVARHARTFAAVLAVGLWMTTPLAALSVQETFWGFDGQIVPDRVNILSVLMANDTDMPFNGTLKLHKQSALQPLGATHVQECFVSPFGRRWVQFYTHNCERDEEWVLSWGRGLNQNTTLRTPRLGPPACVILVDRADPFARKMALKAFPEEIFPVTAAATDALDTLIIDHVPPWEPVRRQAFLEWLRRGGTVHLLADPKGSRLTFPAELAVLNVDLDRFRVGAGRVVRHQLTRGAIDPGRLAVKGFPPLRLTQKSDWQAVDRIEDPVFRRLRGFTRADHNWWLIYVVALIYIVLVGPVNYLLGRKWRDFRLTILVFVGAVVLFSVVLERIGRRGHGEAAAVHALTYARPVGPDTYDVTQWLNAFVTRGAYYTVEHASPHSLYSTCQLEERVNGIIRNGKDGVFAVDMPLYSSRSFLHRGVMKGPELGLKVLRWEGGAVPGQLVLGFGAAFPTDAVEMWALAGERFLELKVQGTELRPADVGQSKSQEEFLKLEHVLGTADFTSFGYYDDASDEVDVLKSYRQLVRPLIAYSLGGGGAFQQNVTGRAPAPDCVQVFVLASRPESFALKGESFGRERGYVLYHVCVFRD